MSTNFNVYVRWAVTINVIKPERERERAHDQFNTLKIHMIGNEKAYTAIEI